MVCIYALREYCACAYSVVHVCGQMEHLVCAGMLLAKCGITCQPRRITANSHRAIHLWIRVCAHIAYQAYVHVYILKWTLHDHIRCILYSMLVFIARVEWMAQPHILTLVWDILDKWKQTLEHWQCNAHTHSK